MRTTKKNIGRALLTAAVLSGMVVANLAHAQQVYTGKLLTDDAGKSIASVGERLLGIEARIVLLRDVSGPGTVGIVAYNDPSNVQQDDGRDYTAIATTWQYNCAHGAMVRTDSNAFGFAPGQDTVAGGFKLDPRTYHTVANAIVTRTLDQVCRVAQPAA